MLAAGIGATLAANVASGLRFGPIGALVAAWPALAVVGSYELLMLVVRGTAVPVAGTEAAGDATEAAKAALEASIAAGKPLSQRGASPAVRDLPVTPGRDRQGGDSGG